MLLSRIYSVLQSSYRASHRTETALLKVINDIMLSMNSNVMLLVLLDLSVTIDTVNHEILVNRLQKKLGSRGQSWTASNHSCLIKLSGYLSVDRFLDASTWASIIHHLFISVD